MDMPVSLACGQLQKFRITAGGGLAIDIVDKQTRSRMMAGIRSKNTKPEMMIRRFLHKMGFRYCLHRKDLPGIPDLVFPGRKTVIFGMGMTASIFAFQRPELNFGKIKLLEISCVTKKIIGS